jgi:hypothetical protein
MNPMAPTLIVFALALGGFGLYLVAAPRRLFTRPEDPARFRPGAVELESERGRWNRFVIGPSLIGTALACVGIAAFGLPASDQGRIALCVALALVPLPVALALPAARPRSLLEWASTLSWGVYLGVVAYSFIDGESSPLGLRLMDFLLLAGALIAAVAAVRGLIVHWRDEAYLVDKHDPAQGYVERPRRLPIRTRAVLETAFVVACLILLIAYFVYRLFSPE